MKVTKTSRGVHFAWTNMHFISGTGTRKPTTRKFSSCFIHAYIAVWLANSFVSGHNLQCWRQLRIQRHHRQDLSQWQFQLEKVAQVLLPRTTCLHLHRPRSNTMNIVMSYFVCHIVRNIKCSCIPWFKQFETLLLTWNLQQSDLRAKQASTGSWPSAFFFIKS